MVRTDKLDARTVIHNYGHGGAGVTLSWGSSTLAVEEALQTGARRFAVLGCGVMGLSTARLLQRAGFEVTIYSSHLPPQTTSNVAGALWFPVSVFDEKSVDARFRDQFTRACRISHRIFQEYVGDSYGIEWLPSYFFFNGERPDPDFPGGNDLYPELGVERDPETSFGFPYAQRFQAMMIDPARYLGSLENDFRIAGGRIVVRRFETLNDVAALDEPVVINCTGLGARQLFGDEAMIPVKGQLSILLPQPEVRYTYVALLPGDLLYMFPRRNEIVLGGSSGHDDWSLEPSPAESARILAGHARIAAALGR